MTQIASLLAVVTVFIGLWTLKSTFYCQGKEGFIRETNYLCKNLSLKYRGYYARGGGIIVGFYSNMCLFCGIVLGGNTVI